MVGSPKVKLKGRPDAGQAGGQCDGGHRFRTVDALVEVQRLVEGGTALPQKQHRLVGVHGGVVVVVDDALLVDWLLQCGRDDFDDFVLFVERAEWVVLHDLSARR